MDVSSSFAITPVFSGGSFGLEPRNKSDFDDEVLMNIDKDKIKTSFSDHEKKDKNSIAIAFRDPKNSQGSKGGVVTINIDKETFEKIKSKFDEKDFVTNNNGVIILNNDAEKHVAQWYDDILTKRGYKRADLNNDGEISEKESKYLMSGMDFKLSYNVSNETVDSVDGEVETAYMNLGRIKRATETDIMSMIESLKDEKLKEFLKQKYKYEIKQSERAQEYHDKLNSMFQKNKSSTVEEALAKTLKADEDSDGKMSLDEMFKQDSLLKDKSAEDTFREFVENDYKKNRLDVDFNKWNDNPLTADGKAQYGKLSIPSNYLDSQNNKGLNPQTINEIRVEGKKTQQEDTKDINVRLMTIEEKEGVINEIRRYIKGPNPDINDGAEDIEEKQSKRAEVVSKNFDLFETVYMQAVEKTEEKEKKERDKKAEDDVKESFHNAINDIDEKWLRDEVKHHLYASRESTINFKEKAKVYEEALAYELVKMNPPELKDGETLEDAAKKIVFVGENILANEMVHLDEFLEDKGLTKEEFFSDKDLKNKFIDSIEHRDDKSVNFDDIIEPRRLNRQEWKDELFDLHEHFSSESMKAKGKVRSMLKDNGMDADELLTLDRVHKDFFSDEKEYEKIRDEMKKEKIFSTLTEFMDTAFRDYTSTNIKAYREIREEQDEKRRDEEMRKNFERNVEKDMAKLMRDDIQKYKSIIDELQAEYEKEGTINGHKLQYA